MKIKVKPHKPPKDQTDWHQWWAWKPIRVSDREMRWLETIERKGEQYCGRSGCSWLWRYRPKQRQRLKRGGK